MSTTITIPTLETQRLTLRAPAPQDFDVFAAFYASDRSRFVGGPLDREGAWRMLAMEIGHWHMAGFGRWIVEPKAGQDGAGETAGIVGLFAPEGWPEPGIGWDLYKGHEGKGYATEAAIAARAYAYDVLCWPTAISLVKPGNEASVRVARRLGCVQEDDFDHPRHGRVQVWRHPAPDSLVDGGMEAYA